MQDSSVQLFGFFLQLTLVNNKVNKNSQCLCEETKEH